MTFSQLKTVPGFTFGAPSGLVPGWGVGFAALSGVHKDSDTDGATAFGFGFGDPFESIGWSSLTIYRKVSIHLTAGLSTEVRLT